MNTLKLDNGCLIPMVGTGPNKYCKEGNVFSGEIAYDKNVIPRKKKWEIRKKSTLYNVDFFSTCLCVIKSLCKWKWYGSQKILF
jgi:hypothetical protein